MRIDWEKHHGHKKAEFGCQDCYKLRYSWVCVCHCPNEPGFACIHCGQSVGETRKRCKNKDCEHSRQKHDDYTGACWPSVRRCPG